MKIKFDLMLSAAEWLSIIKSAALVGTSAGLTFLLGKVIDFSSSAPIVVAVLTIGITILTKSLSLSFEGAEPKTIEDTKSVETKPEQLNEEHQ